MRASRMSHLPCFKQVSATSLSDQVPWDSSGSFGDALLAPTEIYVKRLLSLVDRIDVKASAAAITAIPIAACCGGFAPVLVLEAKVASSIYSTSASAEIAVIWIAGRCTYYGWRIS